ncbi:immunity protein YezG family protein [Macrococcus armenti]|uniref:immunity protein YezG family protein n=1 Tax=Macrococcus armenti TaxID=2875764 RepID=UPI001CCB1B20|nr:immunity protein YezG family protein [Macrococcus armenti]UBH14806.1 antitoxin YezG family protein [Macrococcus armenti]UBH17165.1 antitoxin YezG family protein [Macrococcus armenti]UBH19431.1 antitoxin YezG family protein [Macrococcus armenti]
MINQLISEKILEVIHQANHMIPEEWHELYINGDINGREGGIYFFYNTIGNQTAWQYSATMQFEIEGYSSEEYRKQQRKLFQLAVDLQQIFRENNQPIWSKVILHVDENMKLTTEFDYSDWYNSEYAGYEYMDYFRDEYLNQPPKHVEMDVVQQIREFKIKENSKQR